MNKRDLMGYLYAFCLSDGGVYKSKNSKNAYFASNMLTKNSDFIYFRSDILENITNVTNTVFHSQKMIRTTTRVHPTYTKIHNRLYSTGRKSIDKHQLTFMDWRFLAIILQGDGSVQVDKRCNSTPIVSLHTNSYSYSENMALKLAIKEKCEIDFNVRQKTYKDKIYWYLKLPTRFYDYFKSNIQDYVLPSFQYKLP